MSNKVFSFFWSSYEELTQNVTWTKGDTLQQATLIILIATLIISFIVWVMDIASHWVFKFLYGIFQ